MLLIFRIMAFRIIGIFVLGLEFLLVANDSIYWARHLSERTSLGFLLLIGKKIMMPEWSSTVLCILVYLLLSFAVYYFLFSDAPYEYEDESSRLPEDD